LRCVPVYSLCPVCPRQHTRAQEWTRTKTHETNRGRRSAGRSLGDKHFGAAPQKKYCTFEKSPHDTPVQQARAKRGGEAQRSTASRVLLQPPPHALRLPNPLALCYSPPLSLPHIKWLPGGLEYKIQPIEKVLGRFGTESKKMPKMNTASLV
jgi:hypothetical protein